MKIVNDEVLEGEEMFSATLTSADNNAIVSQHSVEITIIDGDGRSCGSSCGRSIAKKSCILLCPGVIIRFRPTDYTVSEGVDGVVTLSVVKLGRSDIPVTATLTTASGTAEGIDLLRCYYFPLHTIHYFPNRWYRLYKS